MIENQLHKINVRMNNIPCTVTWNKKVSACFSLYIKLNYLKLHDNCNLELAKFVHKIGDNKLPFRFNNDLIKLN